MPFLVVYKKNLCLLVDTKRLNSCFAGTAQRRGHQGGMQVRGASSCRAAPAVNSALALQVASKPSSISPVSLAEGRRRATRQETAAGTIPARK